MALAPGFGMLLRSAAPGTAGRATAFVAVSRLTGAWLIALIALVAAIRRSRACGLAATLLVAIIFVAHAHRLASFFT